MFVYVLKRRERLLPVYSGSILTVDVGENWRWLRSGAGPDEYLMDSIPGSSISLKVLNCQAGVSCV